MMGERIKRLRYRLARLLVGGAFFRLPGAGSWIVNHDAEHDTTFAVRLTEWEGTLTTQLPSLDYTGDIRYVGLTTTGSFTGRYVS